VIRSPSSADSSPADANWSAISAASASVFWFATRKSLYSPRSSANCAVRITTAITSTSSAADAPPTSALFRRANIRSWYQALGRRATIGSLAR
jgi:hypothetical protein